MTSLPGWLDPQQPHEAGHSQRQIRELIELISPAPKEVLDLGCGAGRCLVPLARAGHNVVGIDGDRSALDRCRAELDQCGSVAKLHEADFLKAWPAAGPFDAICCLGNTMMTVWEPRNAAKLTQRARATLKPHGAFIIDNIPGDFWPEVTSGAWQGGVSEDGSLQLAWAADDAIFTLRGGNTIDPGVDELQPGEPRFRLWTMGSLTLLAMLAGLSAPERSNEESLLIMRAPG